MAGMYGEPLQPTGLFSFLQLVFLLLPISFRRLDFRQNCALNEVGINTVKISDPENIIVYTGIMFVSRRIPKLEEEGCNLASTPAVHIKQIRPPSKG